MAKLIEDIKQELRDQAEQMFAALDPDLEEIEQMSVEEVRAELREQGIDVDRILARIAPLIEEETLPSPAPEGAPECWTPIVKEVGIAIEDTPPQVTKADLLEEHSTDYWPLEGTGELLVAADASVTQEHEFDTVIGPIKIVCAYGRAVGEEPAFIWLSWDADIPKEREFLIRLVNSENHEIRYEVRPGTIRKGEQAFTAEELEFDPSEEKLAITLVIPKLG